MKKLPLLAIAVLLIFLGLYMQFSKESPTLPESLRNLTNVKQDAIQPVPAAVLASLSEQAPQAKQPILLEFYSKYCHDCQKMAPDIKALKEAYPAIWTHQVDVLAKDPRAQAWVRALGPTITPTVVLITPDHSIKTAVVGYQSKSDLEQFYKELQATVPEGN